MHHDRLGIREQKVDWSLLPPALPQTQAAHMPADLGWYLFLVLCRLHQDHPPLGACD